jgi:hypothetical protein
VVSGTDRLAAIAPCAAGADARQWAQGFLQQFGALAYRAPVTDAADIARHRAVFDAGAKVSYAHGIELFSRVLGRAR